MAPAVLNHRIILNYKARFDGVDTVAVTDELLDSLDEAELNLPRDVQVTGEADE